jgi:hypothetical protein|tara:strand:- start:151 stop:309 length:159 start_codon:yes stop_codon:yes gene_type:complete
MKKINKKLFLSAVIVITVVLSAAANANNGTKKPPSLSLLEFNASLLVNKKAE